MCYDVSQKHRQSIKNNNIRMHEIEKEFPNDFFTNEEWKKLCEENRMHSMLISDYERKIRLGIKF